MSSIRIMFLRLHSLRKQPTFREATNGFPANRDSLASLCLIVFRITSVPLLKDILQKLNTTLTLETMGVH